MLRRLGIIEEETDTHLETMDETDNQTLDSYSGQPDVLSEMILTFALLFVFFRFLFELNRKQAQEEDSQEKDLHYSWIGIEG